MVSLLTEGTFPILSQLSIDTLLDRCLQISAFQLASQDDEFWKRLFSLRYPNLVDQKLESMSWRTLYLTIFDPPITDDDKGFAVDRIEKELTRRAGTHIMDPLKAYVEISQFTSEMKKVFLARSIEEAIVMWMEDDPEASYDRIDDVIRYETDPDKINLLDIVVSSVIKDLTSHDIKELPVVIRN